MTARTIRIIFACLLFAAASGCARKQAVLEFHALVRYDKPAIVAVSHDLRDARRDGGTVEVTVSIEGDPGLAASFDITPSIVDAQPMQETEDGRYVGRYAFPSSAIGGPFTVIGRLRHDAAGEVVRRDPTPFTIPLLR